LIGILLFIIVAETVLRFLPVTESFRSMPVNADSPIFRCQPNRTVRWSAFWNFSMRNVVRINNYGFASAIDYDASDRGPLLALVGDSFVEALTVSWPQSTAGILHGALANHARVYAFSKSGAPMSQYLVFAEYAKQAFRPSALVVVIVANDFDQSLLQYKRSPGFHHFVEEAGGGLSLRRLDFAVSPWKEALRRSALGRYLLVNAELHTLPDRLKHLLRKERFVGNAPAQADSARLANSKRVVETFLTMLPAKAGLEPARILFVLDGMRPQLYHEQALTSASASYFALMRRYFVERATAQGFEVIDMHPIFTQHYKTHGQKFEYSRDNHWNGTGHALVAQAVLASQIVTRAFAAPQSEPVRF
jgi:hypothetical protein